MGRPIDADFVTLDPKDGRQWKLCRLIIEYTYRYLRRPTPRQTTATRWSEITEHLWPQGDSWSAGTWGANEWRAHLPSWLAAEIKRRERRYADFDMPVQLTAAWLDWQARQSAFAGTHIEYQPVYFAALDELQKDFTDPPAVEGLERDDYLMLAPAAILVCCLSSSSSAVQWMLTSLPVIQLSRTPTVMWMRMACTISKSNQSWPLKASS